MTEINARLKQNDLIIIPVGSTECHGAAQPLGEDTFLVTRMAEQVALKMGCTVAEPVWYGSHPYNHLGMPGTVALVMTAADQPMAYFLAREILGTAEVLNLAVVPEFRGRGLGAELLDAGLSAVRARGGSEVFLEVRASNAVAQALYAGRGFRTEGRRRGYYRRPDEDALVLRLVMAPVRSNDGDGEALV
jgi:ribosomal-protein-alanine acetyltransferase